MSSAVYICNLALMRIGHSKTISALTEASHEASLCNTLYEPLRDEVVQAAHWPFATKYAALGLVEEEPNADWGYAYRYPSDCARVRRIVTGTRRDPNPPAFTIGQDDQGLLLYTDQETATIEYTVWQTDPARFSPEFTNALSYRLGADLAMPLARGAGHELRDTLMGYYQEAVKQAQAQADNESQRDDPPDAEVIRARI